MFMRVFSNIRRHIIRYYPELSEFMPKKFDDLDLIGKSILIDGGSKAFIEYLQICQINAEENQSPNNYGISINTDFFKK